MDFLTSIFGTEGLVLGTLVPFLFVLTIVVFFHELGHYLVGRWCGIGAEVFSVGFGRELIGFTDRRGTRWRLSLIPLGGYVRFVGDENAASAGHADTSTLSAEKQALAFHTKSVWRRAATVFAGPAANFILAVVIFSITIAVYGRVVADPIVAEVRPDSPAAAAGIQPGDRFVSLDGSPVVTFEDVQRYVQPRAGLPIIFVMDRNGEAFEATVTPDASEITDRFGNRITQGLIGVMNSVDVGNYRTITYTPLQAVERGFAETWDIVERTGSYIAGIFTGREKADQIGGPIRGAPVSGPGATPGFSALLNLAAKLSVSVGLLNLLPVPMLDGGHLVFYAVEAVRGKPLGERAQEYGFRIGLTLILMLMLFATWNDIAMLVTAG